MRPFDEIDAIILRELERDADRSNLELARTVGLSPPATLNRVRRLKERGVVRSIRAQLDLTAVGFPLQVYVEVSLGQHDERGHRRFEAAVERIPQVISADWVTGETDALLQVVARDVDELQRTLMLLSAAGAQRQRTMLRLESLKSRAPLPEPA